MTSAWRPRRVALRTRGDRSYGWGHVVRTTRFAQALRSRYGPECRLLCFAEGDEPVFRYLQGGPFEVVSLQDRGDREVAQAFAPFDLSVLDLHLPPPHVEQVWARRAKVSVRFADVPEGPFASDILVCPQLLSEATPPRAGAARVCRGPDYFVMPEPGPTGPGSGAQPLVVVMMGGGAIHREANLLAARALAQAAKKAPFHARFLVGFDDSDALAREVRAVLPEAEVVQGDRDPLATMRTATVGLFAGGFSKYEAAFCGLPLLLVANRPHEEPLARSFERTGAGRYLGRVEDCEPGAFGMEIASLLADPKRRATMAAAGRALVDGRGSARLMDVIEDVAEAPSGSLRLRPAGQADKRLIWEWANDPAVRAASFLTAPIPWADHERWFATRLRDSRCRIFIGLDEGGEPVGQVRVETDAATAEIHLSVAKEQRGKGTGTALIRAGTRKALAMPGVTRVLAHVKPDNAPSLRAFERAGYARVGLLRFKDHDAVQFIFPPQEAPT